MISKEEKASALGAPLLSLEEAEGAAGASISQSSFNLVKNLVGSGVLGLPSAMAACGSTRSIWTGACIVLALMAALCGYCFALLGQLCSETLAESYGAAWSVTLGAGTAWIPQFFCVIKTFSGCLAYSMILADSFSDIFSSLGVPLFLAGRTQALWMVTVAVLLPLCLQRSLKALAPFSFLGVVAMVYIACFMGIRWYDGSYQPGGRYFNSIPVDYQPYFGEDNAFKGTGLLILISMASTAFIAHYNAPTFYWQLRGRSPARYRIVVIISFSCALLLTGLVGCFGFLTFGGASNGLVLNNYSVKDPLATLARTCISISLLFGYPLLFTAFRDGVLDMAGHDRHHPPSKSQQSQRDALSIGLLTFVTVLAMFIRDLGFFLAFAGALLGATIVYIIPAAMALGGAQRGNVSSSAFGKFFNLIVLLLGVLFMVLGGVVTVLKKFTHILQ